MTTATLTASTATAADTADVTVSVKAATAANTETTAVTTQMPELLVKKLSSDACIPSRGSNDAAGYDLSSAHDLLIPAHGKAIAKTDLAISLPEGCYGRVAPRSGLSWKNHIDLGAGVIDRDYRGNVGVVMFNHSDVDYRVHRGDRVAQLLVERILTPTVRQVEDLDETVRGAGGFGSTGVKRKAENEPQAV
eukprot:GFYU01013130.1.p1 GENE.GFYU01013130.1~~GFYU01013130.1.p1  ORF type:complete len:216 (+),score=51.66 GFYU01013130.1:74-649(+)